MRTNTFIKFIKVFLVIISVFILAGQAPAKDLRAVRIEKFLTKYNPTSPLRNKAHEILYCADIFGLDYRLYLAISGAESTYGKNYPKVSKNLTGILNGKTRFQSIYDNIYYTSKLLATGKWYAKFNKTKKIEDFVYIYKGVPPYDRYIRTLRFTLDGISAVSIKDELAQQNLLLALNSQKEKAKRRQKQEESLLVWNSIRYDQFEPGKVNKLYPMTDGNYSDLLNYSLSPALCDSGPFFFSPGDVHLQIR